MLMLVSIGMFAFPTRLPASRTPPKRADAKKPSLRGKRLIYRGDANWVGRCLSPGHIRSRRFNLILWLLLLPSLPASKLAGGRGREREKVSSPRNRLLIATHALHIRLDSVRTFRICFPFLERNERRIEGRKQDSLYYCSFTRLREFCLFVCLKRFKSIIVRGILFTWNICTLALCGGAIMYSVDVYREEKTRANKMIFEA